MDQELFNPQSSSVTSSRILYTPSTFARTSLLHLQEVGSLQAIHPHTSTRTNLPRFCASWSCPGTEPSHMKERPMSCQLETVCSSIAGKRIVIRPGIAPVRIIPV